MRWRSQLCRGCLSVEEQVTAEGGGGNTIHLRLLCPAEGDRAWAVAPEHKDHNGDGMQGDHEVCDGFNPSLDARGSLSTVPTASKGSRAVPKVTSLL